MKMKTMTAALLILPFLALPVLGSGPGDAGQDPTRTPKVTVRKNQRMLVLMAKGDPEKVGDDAMKILYRHFFRNATEAEKNAPLAPRVRWTIAAPDVRKKDWIGKYALPVSAGFPETTGEGTVLEEWRYGLTAELLHIGAPGGKPASIEILKGYIARNGFTITGDLEEEYLQGRGTFFQGGPEHHRTLLRFSIMGIQDFTGHGMPLSSAPRLKPE
jgi:hypothetical protein